MISVGKIGITVDCTECDVKPMRLGPEINQKGGTASLAEDAVRAFRVGVTAEVVFPGCPTKCAPGYTAPSRKGGAVNFPADRTMAMTIFFNAATYLVPNG
jgi:hypothetical protein